MSVDNVYSFTVQRQNSADMPPGKSPCVKIKFIKDESLPNASQKNKISNNEILQKDYQVSGITKLCEEVKLESKTESLSPPQSVNIHANISSSECLKLLLIQLHEVVKKRDSSGIFALPVNEDHAPNYSSIISRPMDLRTIRSKIDNGIYRTVAQMFDDIILMLNNALIYNDSNTVYHRIASQLLNSTKKSFSKDHLNKFVQTKMAWHRALTDDEIGDVSSGLHRIKSIQCNRPKTRPNRIIHKNPHMDFIIKRRRGRPDSQSTSNSKRQRTSSTEDDVIGIKDEPDYDKSFSFNTNNNNNNNSNMTYAQSEESSSGSESEEDAADEILYMAQRAAQEAKTRLDRSRWQRPVVYLERRGEETCVVNSGTGACTKLAGDMDGMVQRIGSVNLERLLGDGGVGGTNCTSVQQLCYDSNECVTLTTSKPLEPYSCAEQAVLVETFGNVITAEYACNMHNYVLDLPATSTAVELVKIRLNAATNYLTYGVDQIITKKLRAFNKCPNVIQSGN